MRRYAVAGYCILIQSETKFPLDIPRGEDRHRSSPLFYYLSVLVFWFLRLLISALRADTVLIECDAAQRAAVDLVLRCTVADALLLVYLEYRRALPNLLPQWLNTGMSVETLGFSLQSIKSVGVLQIQSCDTSHGIVLLIVILSRSSCGRSEVLDSLQASFSILIINIIFGDGYPIFSSLSTAF